MFKKIGFIALLVVLILTMVGFSSNTNYESYNLSGNGGGWFIDSCKHEF